VAPYLERNEKKRFLEGRSNDIANNEQHETPPNFAPGQQQLQLQPQQTFATDGHAL
jgi:hypothetical protein